MGIRKNGTKGNDMEFLNHQKWNIAVILVSIILLVSATVHRGQLDLSRQEYVESLLIPIEMLSMISIFLMNLVNFILLIKHLIKRQWKKLFITIGVMAFSIALLIISMQIDAPTLVYMT